MADIKISDLATKVDLILTDLLAVSDPSGTLFKSDLQKIANLVSTSSGAGFKGALTISEATATDLADGFYFPSESGDYVLANGVTKTVVLTNNLVILVVGATHTTLDMLVNPITTSVSKTFDKTNDDDAASMKAIADEFNPLIAQKLSKNINITPFYKWSDSDNHLYNVANINGFGGSAINTLTPNYESHEIVLNTNSSGNFFLQFDGDILKSKLNYDGRVNFNVELTSQNSGSIRFQVRKNNVGSPNYGDTTFTFTAGETKTLSFFSDLPLLPEVASFRIIAISGTALFLNNLTFKQTLISTGIDNVDSLSFETEFLATKDNLSVSIAKEVVNRNSAILNEKTERISEDLKNEDFSRNVVNQKIWLSTADHPDIEKYRKFILDFKNVSGFVESGEYYIDKIARVSEDVNDPNYNIIEIRVRDSSGVILRELIPIGTGVQTFLSRYTNHDANITVDWNELYFMYNGGGFTGGTFANAPLNNDTIFAEESFYSLLNKENEFKSIVNIHENWDSRDTAISFTNPNHATIGASYVQNKGITIDISDYGTGSKILVSNQLLKIKPSDYFAISVKYNVNSENMTDGVENEVGVSDVLGNNSAGFDITLNRSGQSVVAQFGGQMITGQKRTQSKIVKAPVGGQFASDWRLFLSTSMSLLENKGIDLNYTIEEICIYPIGRNIDFISQFQDSNLSRFLESLNAKEIAEKKHFVNHAYTASNLLNFYTGKRLFVYSASVWETLVQATFIADRTGLLFNSTMARDGLDGYVNTTQGGAQLTPVISGGNGSNKASGDSHFARIVTSWEHYVTNYGSREGNVIMLPFGYNHPGANPTTGNMKPFIAGGTAIEDDDFGLDRASNPPFTDYVNYERDLVADNTLDTVASYGSYLRGIVEFILAKDPFCEIFIPTIYFAENYDHPARRLYDAQIAVNIQVAKEYGFSSPRVDLRAGVTGLNKKSILKDGIHPEKVVGERSALAVLAAMGAI